MPTQSEYQNIILQPTNTTPTDATAPGDTSTTDTQCSALKPLFDQSPELRDAFGCTVSQETPIVVDFCEQVAAAISAKVKADLDSCIEPCRLSYEQCNACIRGAMQRDIDVIRLTVDNCSQKINDDLMFIWHDLNGAMNKIGIPELTTEDIQSILAGGSIPLPTQPIADVPADYSPTLPVTPIYTGPITPLTGVDVTQSPKIPTPTVEPTPIVQPISEPIRPSPIPTPLPVEPVGGQAPSPIGQPVVNPPSPSPSPSPTTPTGGGFGQTYVICHKDDPCTTCAAWNSPYDMLFTPGTTFPDGTIIVGGPFGTGIDGGQNAAQWQGANQATIRQYSDPSNCSGSGPTPIVPPPTPTCQQCQAGYQWSTDSNGNPVCKPSCQCPVCPTQPTQPVTQPTQPPSTGETSPSTPAVMLCGPDTRQRVTDWLKGLVDKGPFTESFVCQPGILDYLTKTFKAEFIPFGKPPDMKFKDAASNTVNCIASWVYDNFVKPNFPQGSCDITQAVIASVQGFVPNLLDHVLGVIPKQITYTLAQQSNFACQYLTPSTQDVNTAWIHGALTNDEWEFGVKINGDCLDWQKKMIESGYQPITWQDAFRLKRLNKIDNAAFTKWLQKNGINTDKDVQVFEDAYAQYPAMGDLIRMMVRDVADENAVEAGEFDNEFTEKFTGQLQQWAEAQGITEDIAKMYWRAHWTLPSPGQLYEMLHRLRRDNRDPDDPYKDTIVDPSDVEDTLKQNDVAPAWVRSLMAISYAPLTRVDVQRGYQVGVLDKDDVFRAYLDRGYTEKNAKTLSNYTTLKANPIVARDNGAMSLPELSRSFIARLITDDEYVNGVRTVTGDDKRTANIYDNQLFKRDVAERKNILASNKKRYMYGEFTDARAVQELVGFGIDLNNANSIIQLWKQELAAKYKAPTVSMLCEWWTRGLITLPDYLQRVRNIGYSQEDAMRIVQVCGMKQNDRLKKEFEKAQKDSQTRAEKQRKALEKAAMDAMPCRPTKPKCPMPGMNGSANGKSG